MSKQKAGKNLKNKELDVDMQNQSCPVKGTRTYGGVFPYPQNHNIPSLFSPSVVEKMIQPLPNYCFHFPFSLFLYWRNVPSHDSIGRQTLSSPESIENLLSLSLRKLRQSLYYKDFWIQTKATKNITFIFLVYKNNLELLYFFHNKIINISSSQ